MDVIILRPVVWILHRLGTRTILVLTLLLTALGCVAFGLTDQVRGLDRDPLLLVVFAGALLGWAFARSPLPGWLAGIMALVIGIEIVFYRVGKLSESVRALAQSLVETALSIAQWRLGGSPPDASSVLPALQELGRGLDLLLTRVYRWSQAVVNGQAAYDSLAVTFVWSLALYAAAVWAGWMTRRHRRALLALAPAGALLAISLSYTWDQPGYLQIMTAVLLLMMVWVGWTARERRWEAKGIDFSPELRFDLVLVTTPLWFALAAIILIVPSVSARPIARYANRLLVEHFYSGRQVADSMGLEPSAGSGIALAGVTAAGLPNQNLIGSGPELSEQTVMTVDTGEAPAGSPMDIDSTSSVPRYYWRAVTYDTYTGRGWRTSTTDTVDYRAGERAREKASCPDGNCQPEAAAGLDTHRMLRQEIQAVDDLGELLYSAGDLVTADHDFSVAWRSPEDAFGAEIDETIYRADSLVPVASEEELRSTWTDYPAWVRDRYLALPSSVPVRVLELAHDLTATAPTPYDQARAIESYLRTFTYTLDVPAPPPNRDVADFFLFDLKKGYCDYYATTMVVLARAVGIPARLAVGYASGTYDPFNAHYVVTASDAHSWVEVYFPYYGWIEFEPTGGRPLIVRPEKPVPLENTEPPAPLEVATTVPTGLLRLVGMGLLGVCLSMGLMGLVWWVVDNWRIQRLAPTAAVNALYRRLYRHGRRLAVPMETGDTPYEFQDELTAHLTALAQDRRFGATVTSANREVRWLTDRFVRGLYSPHSLAASEKSKAVKTWRRLRRKLWLARIWRRTNRKDHNQR